MPSVIYSYKIKARQFHSTKRFINDFCAENDGGEFGRSIYDIFLKELELKVEKQGDHATFLNLDITNKERTLIYKLFYKIFNCKNAISLKIFFIQQSKVSFLEFLVQLYASATLYLRLKYY